MESEFYLLKAKKPNGEILENFLIDKNGNLVKRFAPTGKPEKIEKDILKLINS
jgi:glutathione peroxidase-family protein